MTTIRVLSMVKTWENFVQEHFCPSSELNASKDPCVQDWNIWLEFGRQSIKGSFFIAQYFLLMTAYFTRHFTTTVSENAADSIQSNDLKILPEPVFGDKTDFTGKWQINNNSKAPSKTNTKDELNKSELDLD